MKRNTIIRLHFYITTTRVGNKLQTSFFWKETFSGVYLNFISHVPSEYKKGLLQTLLYRAFNICSNCTNLHKEIIYLKSIWRKNSFPLLFINKCVRKFRVNTPLVIPVETTWKQPFWEKKKWLSSEILKKLYLHI